MTQSTNCFSHVVGTALALKKILYKNIKGTDTFLTLKRKSLSTRNYNLRQSTHVNEKSYYTDGLSSGMYIYRMEFNNLTHITL